MLGGDLLPLVAVEVFQVLFGHLAGAALVGHLVDHRHRRLGQDAFGRGHDLELVRAQFVDGQKCLVLPGQQHITQTALDKGVGGAAGAGIKHRYVLEQLG